MSATLRGCLALLLLFLFIVHPAKTTMADREPIIEALGWMRSAPLSPAQYDYVMTARVRLLLFWAGKDDVGGGYIRRGVSPEDPHREFFQVLFGSDPAKAPRAINRWGAGTEVVWHKEAVAAPGKIDIASASPNGDVTATAFFGFMKSSKGKSVSEMQEELKKEKDHAEHDFTGILSRVEPGHAISLIVPLASSEDYTLHQYATAEPVMLEKIEASQRTARTLDDQAGCARGEEFLGTVAHLMDAALASQKAPLSSCYVYDAQVNTLTITRIEPIQKFAVKVNSAKGGTLEDKTYDDVLQADFVSTHKLTGKRVYFSIVMGTKGELLAVPIQIRYQPNWWFQVVLNLLQKENPPMQARSDAH